MGKLMDHIGHIVLTVIGIVFFAYPNQSVANGIMGGMGCEIINLKTLTMVNGESKEFDDYGDMRIGSEVFITYSYGSEESGEATFSFLFTENYEEEFHDIEVSFTPTLPLDNEKFFYEPDILSENGDVGVKVIGDTRQIILQKDSIDLKDPLNHLLAQRVEEQYWQAMITKSELYQSSIFTLLCFHSADVLSELISEMQKYAE